jgi:hypothetical protein
VFAGQTPRSRQVSRSSSRDFRIASEFDRNRASTSPVERFPKRIQTIFGGSLSNTLRSANSESFDTIAKPLPLAQSQTATAVAI